MSVQTNLSKVITRKELAILKGVSEKTASKLYNIYMHIIGKDCFPDRLPLTFGDVEYIDKCFYTQKEKSVIKQ
jgi:hypothetical protein